ncbi:MAG TPA: hypothetical protein VLG28_11260 [Acidimicrobiia bacterium]|jgi:hypothetical protein|nr:hypothetical protein [Acidimicrobiia bacterium]
MTELERREIERARSLQELAGLRIAIDDARREVDVPRLAELTRRRDRLRQRIAVLEDPSVERTMLEHELAGLREQVSAPPPNLGLSLATTSSVGQGGSASAGFAHGKYNRAVNNDDTGGHRSRNDALARIAWIEQRLAELGPTAV